MNISRPLAFLVPVFALAMLAAPATSIAAPKAACDMLTMADIGKVLGGKVEIDKNQSGPDDRGGDNCVWTGPNSGIVLIRVQPVVDKNQLQARYKGALEEAYAGGKAPETVAGVGAEAKYRNYAGNLKGGVIVGRKGQAIFVVEGSTNRETLAALANTLLSRM